MDKKQQFLNDFSGPDAKGTDYVDPNALTKMNDLIHCARFLLRNTFDFKEQNTLDDDSNWNDLSPQTPYCFISLKGTGAPDANSLGEQSGIVLPFQFGKQGLFEFAITYRGMAYRLTGHPWYYVGNGIPDWIDADNLVDQQYLEKYVSDVTGQLVDTHDLSNFVSNDEFQTLLNNFVDLQKTDHGTYVQIQSNVNDLYHQYTSDVSSADIRMDSANKHVADRISLENINSANATSSLSADFNSVDASMNYMDDSNNNHFASLSTSANTDAVSNSNRITSLSSSNVDDKNQLNSEISSLGTSTNSAEFLNATHIAGNESLINSLSASTSTNEVNTANNLNSNNAELSNHTNSLNSQANNINGLNNSAQANSWSNSVNNQLVNSLSTSTFWMSSSASLDYIRASNNARNGINSVQGNVNNLSNSAHQDYQNATTSLTNDINNLNQNATNNFNQLFSHPLMSSADNASDAQEASIDKNNLIIIYPDS